MNNFALRTAVIYFLAGSIWILTSDWLMEISVPLQFQSSIASVKGILFVLFTAIVLYIMLEKYVKKLRQNEMQYRALFRSHPQPLWIYDIKTLKFLAVNNAAEKKYGYTHEEFMNMSMLDIRPPDERAAIKQFLLKVEKEDYVADLTHLHRAKDGRTFYTRTSSHATVFNGRRARMVMAVDAEAEKEAERKLNLSEIKLNSLLNNSEDIIWVYDETGHIVTYNQSFKKKFKEVFGTEVPNEERIKLNSDLSDPVVKKWRSYLERALQGEHIRSEQGFKNLASNQMEYFEILMTPINDASNKQIGVGCFARDITERKSHEHEIEEKVRQLKDIAWIQSHTVRRPLANIMGLVELIKLNPADREQIDESVSLLEKSCHELDEIIREVVKRSSDVK